MDAPGLVLGLESIEPTAHAMAPFSLFPRKRAVSDPLSFPPSFPPSSVSSPRSSSSSLASFGSPNKRPRLLDVPAPPSQASNLSTTLTTRPSTLALKLVGRTQGARKLATSPVALQAGCLSSFSFSLEEEEVAADFADAPSPAARRRLGASSFSCVSASFLNSEECDVSDATESSASETLSDAADCGETLFDEDSDSDSSSDEEDEAAAVARAFAQSYGPLYGGPGAGEEGRGGLRVVAAERGGEEEEGWDDTGSDDDRGEGEGEGGHL